MRPLVRAPGRRIEWVRVGSGTYVARIDGKLTTWRALRNDNEGQHSPIQWMLIRSEEDDWPPAKENWALKGLTQWLEKHLEKQAAREMRDDRQELDTIREIIEEELYDWGQDPLGQKPGYLSPIAADAGVSIREVDRLAAAMKRVEHKNATELERLHYQIGDLIDEMREQVKNASLSQIEGYMRAREEWIDEPAVARESFRNSASRGLLRESLAGTWYHGSPTRLERFHRRVTPTFGTGASEVPIFLTQDIDFAQLHAGPSGFIYTVRPHVKRTFDATTFVLDEKYWPPPRDALNSDGQAFYDDLVDNRIFPELIRYGTKHEQEDEWGTMHDSNGTYASILARQYDVMETTEMKRWMLAHDYDSFFVRGDGPKNNLAVFDPSKVEILSTESNQ